MDLLQIEDDHLGRETQIRTTEPKGEAMRLAQAFCLCSAIMCASFDAAATQRPNIQVRACLAWDARLQMMLEFSERYGIHDAGLRHMVQTEVRSLKPRCIRDIGQSSLNRYVLLTKLLHDDEADEVEMFE